MQFFSLHSAYRMVAATSCLCLSASTAWCQAHFKPDVVRKYGGIYASDCKNSESPRLRVLRDALVVEQGDKRIIGHKVETSFSYRGPSIPPAFKLTLVSEVRSGSALGFMVFEDKTGTSIHLLADAALQATLGKVLFSPTYHRCEDSPSSNAATAAVQREPMSDAEKMLLDPAFKATYLRILGPLVREAWLAKFNGPRPPARRTKVGGMDYLLLAVCKPHSCADFNAVLLYAEDRDRLFGKVYQQGSVGYLGEPPPDIADALDTLWASQWQQK